MARISFEEYFGDKSTNDPQVVEEIRKQGLANLIHILKGNRIDEKVRRTTEFAVNKFIETSQSPQLKITLTWQAIEEARKKLLTPKDLLIDQPKEETPKEAVKRSK